MSLNPAQQAAVDHRGSPLLVLAGAGTGKTRVITHRVASLIAEGVPAWQILAVTFTNKAAGEMRERIGELIDADPRREGLWVGTFHSICARILRRYGEGVGLSKNFSIYDMSDQKALMTRVLRDLNIDDRMHTPQSILGSIDRAKNAGVGPSALNEVGIVEPTRAVVERAWREYKKRCLAADAADFGDLLTLAVELLNQKPVGLLLAQDDPVQRLKRRFSHVVVDEYQDTNPVQARLVELLSGQAEVCVVGDDDQSIYGWRGADVAQILEFPEDNPGTEVIRLEQNYRSTNHILECADAIIKGNQGRLGKTLWSDLGEGELVRVQQFFDEREEASYVARTVAMEMFELGASADEFAVFYRTHAQSRALEEALRREGVHYRVVGGTRFFDRLEIKDLIAYLRLLVTPRSDVDCVRIINRPARGIGQKTVERLALHAAQNGMALYQATEAKHAKAAGLKTAALRRVAEFRQMMEALREEMEGLSLPDVAESVLERSGYLAALQQDDSTEAEARIENLQEFVGALAEFIAEDPEGSLAEYLEIVSLATDQDQNLDKSELLSLMTIHSAKGLEFRHVFLTGMEEGIFPHGRAIDDPDQMEEERRLAYVAVTRAKRKLHVSLCQTRWIYGSQQRNPASRFISALPEASIELLGVRRRPNYRFNHDDIEDPVPEPEPSWDDDIELEEAAASGQEGVPIYAGMCVRHAKFGVGEVLSWSGVGAHMKLQLRFDSGTKTILARFCEPV